MRYFLLILLTVATCAFAREDSTTLQIKQIEDGVFLHTSYMKTESYGLVGSNGLVVVDGHEVIIIDTPWSESDTRELLSWVNEKGFSVKASISTHFHEDRTAGIEVLNSESVSTYTSELTNELLIREGKPTASNVLSDSEFTLSEGLVEVFYPGAGHTRDNLVVWLPKNRILVGGCLVRSLKSKGLGNTGDADINSWAESIRRIQSKYPQIETIVPGHGKVADKSALDHTINLAEKATGKSIQPTANQVTD
jgi:glyoxylase-like metal-dependent hydrolase (beta-lactamase superfamily II)